MELKKINNPCNDRIITKYKIKKLKRVYENSLMKEVVPPPPIQALKLWVFQVKKKI